MIFEGDSSVMNALKEKKRLRDAGESHAHIKPLLIIDGGLMKGVYGAGAVLALDELGFTDCFSAVVGISSGAVEAAYLLSSDKIGATIFYEECCTREFVPRFDMKNVINTKFIERVLAGETGKRLNFKKIFSHVVPLFIGVSDFLTARPVLLQPSNEMDLLTAIRASISMPGAVTLPAVLDGVRYVDGASTEPHILSHICETLPATHILIVTNQDKGTKHISWFEHFTLYTFFRGRINATLRHAASWRREARHTFVKKALAEPVKPILFVWGNNSVRSKDSRAELLKQTIEVSRLWWLRQLRS
jgi:predicted patatin/cPLA2 family phospholipase